MYVLDGKALRFGSQFEHNGTVYPFNWLDVSTAADREALGIVEMPDPVRPDDRFYIVTYDEATFAYTSKPKDLAELKVDFKAAANKQAHQLLSSSDWMVIRKIEEATPIPADWAAYRTSVRAYANKFQSDIDSAQNVPVLEALVNGQSWPIDPVAAAELAKMKAA